MDFSSLYERLKMEMGSLFSNLTEDEVIAASNKAGMELGWELPIDDTLKDKCFWYGERTRRHCFEIIRSGAAFKFDYKQAKLSDRFEQLTVMVKEMDEQFTKALEDRPELFGNVNASAMFGTYISSGFQNDAYGRDTTYSQYNIVKQQGAK